MCYIIQHFQIRLRYIIFNADIHIQNNNRKLLVTFAKKIFLGEP